MYYPMNGKIIKRKIMIDMFGKIVIGVLTMAVCAGCGILWDVSNTLTEIKTTLIYIETDSSNHDKHLHEHDEAIHDLDKRVTKLESK